MHAKKITRNPVVHETVYSSVKIHQIWLFELFGFTSNISTAEYLLNNIREFVIDLSNRPELPLRRETITSPSHTFIRTQFSTVPLRKKRTSQRGREMGAKVGQRKDVFADRLPPHRLSAKFQIKWCPYTLFIFRQRCHPTNYLTFQ